MTAIPHGKRSGNSGELTTVIKVSGVILRLAERMRLEPKILGEQFRFSTNCDESIGLGEIAPDEAGGTLAARVSFGSKANSSHSGRVAECLCVQIAPQGSALIY